MGKTQVKSNSKEFLNKLFKFGKEYRKEIMKAGALAMANARNKAADEYIIPRKASGSISTLRRRQPSHPTKLTERSGLLKRVLKARGEWKLTSQNARLKAGNHLDARIATKKLSKTIETYLMTIAVRPRNNKAVRYRILHELTGGRWGVKRSFLGPAVNDESKKLLPLIKKVQGNKKI